MIFVLFSLTWHPMGDKDLKRYFSLNDFWMNFSWIFFPMVLTQNYVLDFWNFDFIIFSRFVLVFVNVGLHGSQTFKTLLLPQIILNIFKLFLNFLYSFPHKSPVWVFLKFTIVPYGETKTLNYLENERPHSETEWNVSLRGKCLVNTGNFWQLSS